jgi:hypothetical protein
MENSFSSLGPEPSDNKPKCSILFYVTEDDTIMFEAGWDNRSNAELNMLNLSYLLYGLRNTDLLEKSMRSAIKQYQESGDEEYAKDMQIILENFEQVENAPKLPESEPNEQSKQKPVVRPLQAK